VDLSRLIGFFLSLKNRKVIIDFVTNTWDKFTDSRLRSLHPDIREAAAGFINEVYNDLGISLRIGSDGHLRTFDEQKRLYDAYIQGSGVKAAAPGASYHNYGLAMDLYWIKKTSLFDPAKDKLTWLKVVKVGEKYGFTWPLAWADPPHFQNTFGYSWQNLLSKYQNNDMVNGYVNLGIV